MTNVAFEAEDREVPTELNSEETKSWLIQIASSENGSIEELTYYFTSDEKLLEINIEYLNHDTYTDIITFEYGSKESIVGDIFISTDRVRENAGDFGCSFEQELNRVIAHGLLHLLGYGDKTEEEKSHMRSLEDSYLSLRNS